MLCLQRDNRVTQHDRKGAGHASPGQETREKTDTTAREGAHEALHTLPEDRQTALPLAIKYFVFIDRKNLATSSRQERESRLAMHH